MSRLFGDTAGYLDRIRRIRERAYARRLGREPRLIGYGRQILALWRREPQRLDLAARVIPFGHSPDQRKKPVEQQTGRQRSQRKHLFRESESEKQCQLE